MEVFCIDQSPLPGFSERFVVHSFPGLFASFTVVQVVSEYVVFVFGFLPLQQD